VPHAILHPAKLFSTALPRPYHGINYAPREGNVPGDWHQQAIQRVPRELLTVRNNPDISLQLAKERHLPS
jgi:hypothetical protein